MLKMLGLIITFIGIMYIGYSRYHPSHHVTLNSPAFLTATGLFASAGDIDIFAEHPGIIKDIRFKANQLVKRGDVLAIIETSLNNSKTQFQLKTIRSPYSGKMHFPQINLGEYVSAETIISSVKPYDPIYIQFELPDQYLPAVYLHQPVDIRIDQSIPFKRAMINAIHGSGNIIYIQATLENPTLNLQPGMMAQVKIWLKTQEKIMTMPE